MITSVTLARGAVEMAPMLHLTPALEWIAPCETFPVDEQFSFCSF
jgi:hypothetical protein